MQNPSSIYSSPVGYPPNSGNMLSWLKDNDICIEMLNETDLIFGKLEIKEDFILINHILLLGKYIYSEKCQNSLPTIQGFIARIRIIYSIELHIAREKCTILKNFQKWETHARTNCTGSTMFFFF